MLDDLHTLATSLLADPVINPLDGVSPSMGPFAVLLDAKWKQLLGVAWLCWLIYATYNFIRAIGEASKERRMGAYGGVSEAREEITKNAFVLAGLVAAPVLVGAIITFAG